MAEKKKIKHIYKCQECVKSIVFEDEVYCMLRCKLQDTIGFIPTQSAKVDTVEDCNWFRRDRVQL